VANPRSINELGSRTADIETASRKIPPLAVLRADVEVKVSLDCVPVATN